MGLNTAWLGSPIFGNAHLIGQGPYRLHASTLHASDPQVAVAVKARMPAMDGSQGTTQPYFETPDDQPLRFTMGDTTLYTAAWLPATTPCPAPECRPQQQTCSPSCQYNTSLSRSRQRASCLVPCSGAGAVPAAIEEGLEAMTRGEHAVVSCARAAAAAPANSLVPSPPGTSDRVEFELRLESMIQVRVRKCVCPGTPGGDAACDLVKTIPSWISARRTVSARVGRVCGWVLTQACIATTATGRRGPNLQDANGSWNAIRVQVRDMTGDGSVVKRRIRDGRGEFPVDCPIEDSSVRVHYRWRSRLPHAARSQSYESTRLASACCPAVCGPLYAGAWLLCGFRVIEPESGRTLLDTRGQDGAAPAVEFQTGAQAAVCVHVQWCSPWCVCTVGSTGQVYNLDQPPGGVLPWSIRSQHS
jgi:hypothetical protein